MAKISSYDPLVDISSANQRLIGVAESLVHVASAGNASTVDTSQIRKQVQDLVDIARTIDIAINQAR